MAISYNSALAGFNDLRLSKKFTVAFGCIVVATLAVAAVLIGSTLTLKGSVDANTRAIVTMDALQAYSKRIDSSQQAITRLVVSGNITYAEEFAASLESVVEARDALLAAVDGEELRQQVTGVAEAYDTWKTSIADRQLAYLQDPYTVDLARFLEASAERDGLDQEIDAMLRELEARYTVLQKERGEQQAATLGWMEAAAIGSGVLLTAMAILFSVFLSRLIAAPLANLAGITNRLKDRDWSVEVERTDRKDEIGDMMRALEVFRDNGVRSEQLEQARREEAERKLTRAREIEASIAAFKKTSQELLTAMAGASDRMASASTQLNEVSSQSASFTENVTRAAGSTGESVQGVASAVEEMSASISEITQQVQKVSVLSRQSAQASDEASGRVLNLRKSADRINNVIDLITNITNQINLLALNATIESARAGEAGRGFAVVASEVKSLAGQAGAATEEITKVIEAIQNDIGSVVDTIGAICKSVKEVSDNSTSVAAAVEEQSAATSEISSNIVQVSNDTSQVVRNVASVQDKVGETRRVAVEVGGLSAQLRESAGTLNTAIAAFIADVAA